MRTGHSSLLMLCGILATLLGCAHRYVASYPDDWPPKIDLPEQSGCSSLAGSYLEYGEIGRENFQYVAETRLGERASLSALLRSGSPTDRSTAIETAPVSLRVAQGDPYGLTFAIGNTVVTPIGREVHCRGGSLTVRGVIDVSNDPQAQRSLKFEYVMSRVVGGGLIVRYRRDERAWRLGPTLYGRSDLVSYYRFFPVPSS